jgi:uncharacterized protein YybS (DUF2232 family)
VNSVRPYIEGAIFCSIYLILLFLFIYTPLGLVVFFVLAVPCFVYAARHGWRLGLPMLAVGLFLSFLLTGWVGIMYTVYYGLVGVVMGSLYMKRNNVWIVLLFGFLTGILLLLLFLGAITFVMHINIAEQIKTLTDSYMDMSRSMLQGLGLERAGEQEMMTRALNQLIDLLPLMLIIQAAFSSFVTYKFANPILKRLGMAVMTLPPYRDWKVPREMIFYYLAVLILSLVIQENTGAFYLIVFNLRQLIDMIFIVLGGSFIFYMAHIKNWNRSLAVILLIIGLIFSPVLALVGLFDTAFQLKARMTR